MLPIRATVLLAILFVTLAEARLAHTHRSLAFNPLEHLGGQSPYFSAPAQYGVSASLPDGCHIDQASYLVRHGARYPTAGSYKGWVNLYSKIQNATFTAKGSLAFLPSWSPPLDDATNQEEMLESLSSREEVQLNADLILTLTQSGTGAGEAFDLGVELRHLGLTAGGADFTVWSAGQQRVVDTAQWFLDGYLSAGHYNIGSLGKIVVMADSVNYTYANSLTATNGCNLFKENDTLASNYRAAYKPAIANRINKHLTGLTLDVTDVGEMMDLCGYQTEIAGYSPFCDVFTRSEWLDFEYAQDLQYYWGSGPGYKYSGTSFWPYLKAITDLNDLSPLIAALGIMNETTLNPTRPDTQRKFRSSYAISFAGRIALERLACSASKSDVREHFANVPQKSPSYKSYVRVKVNDAVVPLPNCSDGPGSSCALNSFVKYVARRGEVVGDFVKTCGVTAANATSLFTAFVDPSSAQ